MWEVTKNDIPEESEFMTLFWKMVKDFYNNDGTLEYWEAVIERSTEIDDNCHSRLGQYLINAFCDFEDEKYKKEHGGERRMYE